MSPPPGNTRGKPEPPIGFVLDGRWRVRTDLNRISDDDVEHQVPDKFMQVLTVLATTPGVVSRRELFDRVWPETHVVDESLTRAISTLRKLLDDDPKSPRIIETIPKKGYRLLASVQPLELPAPRASETPPSPTVPSRSRALPAMALSLVLATVILGSWWLAGRFSTSRPQQVKNVQVTALPGVEEYPELSPAGDRIVFVWDGGEAEPDGVFVKTIGAASAQRLTTAPGHYAFPTWTPDSRFIAYARVAGSSTGIFKVPATGGAEIELVPSNDGSTLISPAFSPDGKCLFFARREASGGPWRLERRSLANGETQVIAPSSSFGHGGYRPRFSPDGGQLAFLSSSAGHSTIVLAAADGSGARPIPLHGRAVSDFDWASDGRSLVVAIDGSIRLVDLDGALGRTLYRTDGVSLVSMATGAAVVAYSRGRLEKNIWLRSPGGGTEADLSRIIQSTAWDTDPVFSPDGSEIAFLSSRTGSTQLWIASRDGSHPRRLTEIDAMLPVPPSWDPAGDRVAIVVEAQDRSTVALVTVSGGQVVLLPSPQGGESRPTWSRDGATLLVSRPAADGSDLWRRSVAPDDPHHAVRLTRGGGYRGLEDPESGAVFFTRVPRGRDIWRSDLDGANPRLAFSLPTGHILGWGLVRNTLLVGSRQRVDDRSYRVVSYDLQSDRVIRSFMVPGRLGFHFDVDPTDPTRIVFDRTETVGSDIMAVTGF